MTPQEVQEDISKCTLEAKRRKLNIMQHKEKNPKGFVSDDTYFLSVKFVDEETKSSVVSDSGNRDKNGCHYLGEMNEVCGYYSGLGFPSEVQGYFTDKNGNKRYHFGDLCCNKGKVKGILQYNLPQKLKHLYTSQDPESKHFERMQDFTIMLWLCLH